jgi:hypothetical protein
MRGLPIDVGEFRAIMLALRAEAPAREILQALRLDHDDEIVGLVLDLEEHVFWFGLQSQPKHSKE